MSKSTTALAGFDAHKDPIVIAVAVAGRNGVSWTIGGQSLTPSARLGLFPARLTVIMP